MPEYVLRDKVTTTTNVHITVLPSQQLHGHFTKFKSKTVTQLNIDCLGSTPSPVGLFVCQDY